MIPGVEGEWAAELIVLRLPAMYISRVSSRQTRNFGFGQSSQSHLRLTGDYLRPGFRPRTTGSFLCVPKERNRKKGHPGLCAPHGYCPCGVPSLEACLSGSEQGPFFAPAFLLRSKDRCAPSVVRPLAGAGIHWIPAFYPARPCPWPGRAVSLPRPFGPALRLRPSLGLSKGVPKQFNCAFSMPSGISPCSA